MKQNSHSLLRSLKARGLKVTAQRQAIVDALLKAPCPATVEEIYRIPECRRLCNLATVYRTLNLFKKKGIVTASQFGDGFARFEVPHDKEHHHHHVVCRDCKKVQALHICIPDKLIKEVSKLGFSELSHNLEFFGLCSKCSK